MCIVYNYVARDAYTHSHMDTNIMDKSNKLFVKLKSIVFTSLLPSDKGDSLPVLFIVYEVV